MISDEGTKPEDITPRKDGHALGDAPVEVDFEAAMNSIAFAIDQILNGKGVMEDKSKRRNGFVLMVFPYGDKSGRANYISNGANREDIIRLFREQLRRFEDIKKKSQ